MPLLISDANILIDMEAGDLQELMFRLPHEELVRARLISVSEARQGYARMKAQGRRLPWSVAEQRLKTWEH